MTIGELVNKYEKSRDTYLKSNYNETQLRTDFLDPFFQLLGWDINNNQSKPTNEREVLVEEALKVDANSNTKKPDYTFRLFSERKFFVEAKKPSVDIANDSSPAKQVRRYGFSAKLKISVLSNFEYLVIYDCSQEVKEDDATQNSRINIYHYTEYEASFSKIKAQLSRDSVYTGEFEEVWKHIEDQLKLHSVDHLFLSQINEWRLLLGNEVYSHNKTISNEELNDIVQRYLNSIIFLRVCEDRNLETYKTLLEFANKKDFKSLIEKFSEADKKYNANLFSHHLVKEIIENSSSAFWEIIQQLYFPESTYSFTVFSSDILGNIYEVFLSEQLVIEDDSISLEKKAENIDRDVVTTPTFIIQNILQETVVEYCKNKNDDEVLSSTFADIACGSGAFLLEVYQLLHDLLVDYYLSNEIEILVPVSSSVYKLPFEIKRTLLENCIFGVDKDFNATEACKFGLLLKLLEDEDVSTIPIPALPNLDNNIFFGNSLIDPSMVQQQDQIEINPYDFNKKKFDVVIGNPPYMATKHMKKLTSLELPLYKKHFNTSFKQFDKYFLFIERGLDLLKDDGYFGYIVPSKFTKVGAGKKLREYLSDNGFVNKIISFGANQVFNDKTTYTCLLVLRKKDQETAQYLEVNNFKDWKTRNIHNDDFDSISKTDLKNEGWILVPKNLKAIYSNVLDQSESLEDLVGADNVYNGIQTSATRIYINTATSSDDNYIYFSKDNKDWKIEKELTRPYFKTSSNNNDNLHTYRPFSPNSFVIYPYLKTDKGIEFVDINKLEQEYPFAFAFLQEYKEALNKESRDIKPTPETPDEWYRYGRHQSLDKCDVPAKIIVGVLSQGNKYAIDYYGTLISSGGTAGYCMITLPDDFPYSIYYIQALLNSKYLEWFSALIGEVFRGGYIARGTKVLKKLPIRVIDFNNTEDEKLHNQISCIQKELIRIQGEIDKNRGNDRTLTPLKRRFEIKKDQLDDILKTLYNLKADDQLIPLISDIYATN